MLTSHRVSSWVIDSLCDRAREQNATVACFYFDFAAQKEQSPTGMLGALLKQLVCGLEETPEEISRAYEDQKCSIGRRGPLLSDIVKMLQITSSRKRTFICIDAVDECEAGYRVKLLDSLNRILKKSPSTRMFMTGRPHIRSEIGRRLSGGVASLFISPKKIDIVRYLRSRITEDTIPDAMDSSLEADILKKIPEEVSEMYVKATLEKLLKLSTNKCIFRFLLVSLNIDAILQETTVYRRRQRLSAMTDGLGLGEVYGATLGRVEGQGGEKSRLGMAVLMWVSHAERPLKANELCQALAVEIGSPDLNTDNVPSIGTLLACCQGLITVDKEASTVRLVHFTLQEYLRCRPDLFGTAHSIMAETCLSYLNSRETKALPTSPLPDLQDFPFLEYSSLYWGVHAQKDLSDCAKLMALRLFDDYSNQASTKILLKAQESHLCVVDFDKIALFSGLHCASFFGIAHIVASLVEVETCDINQRDCVGNTPLVWAAHNGHEEVVKALLERDDVDPNEPDRNGRTPLNCAAICGRMGVVKILLGRGDVSLNKPDNNGRTPLGWATMCGHGVIVETLLGRDDITPDKPDDEGITPLWWAAQKGYEEIVKILLARTDVNPNKPDKDVRTPLHRAALGGHEGVVKTLLERDGVRPDQPNNYGQTPLSHAAVKGHEGVVRLLLERDDIDPDKPTNNGRTPLSSAAACGHEEVVKMLLKRDVNSNKPDKDGQTPLHRAALGGHEGVVKTLLERDGARPDQPNNDGQTPLSCATASGHTGVVKILLGRDDVNPHRPDKSGLTPLQQATESGHTGMVALLQPPASATPRAT